MSLAAQAKDEEWSISAIRRRGPHPSKAFSSESVGGDPVLGTDRYRLMLAGTWAGEQIESHLRPDEPADRPVAGVELRGVVPARVIYPFDRKARRLGSILRRGIMVGGLPPSDVYELQRDDELGHQFIGFWASKAVVAITGRPVSSLQDALGSAIALRPAHRSQIRGLIADHVGRYRRRADVPPSFERVSLPVHLEEAAAALTSTLNQVRHLGPLRDAPRPFHSISTSGDPYSVGRSGEFTAAVLHRFGKRSVAHHLDGHDYDEPLGTAVNRWLTSLGVHSGARTVEYGKIGHLLTVDDEAVPYYMDLTQVGVGVSQLLPVLVQVLVAPPGSVLVVEQPELHLHPRVQSRLADLFVSAAMNDRQIICETHSEYMVTRLRLLVAAERIAYGAVLRVHFVERREGASTVREVRFGRRGEVPEWPEGFFDQSAIDAADLVRAATKSV
jgi:hypothetical protein